METKYAVTYGRTNFFAEEGLKTIFLHSAQQVQDLAMQFIHVIPDELEWYQNEIAQWNGNSDLILTHQDDDTFLFYCTPVVPTTDFGDFHSFVNSNNADPSNRFARCIAFLP